MPARAGSYIPVLCIVLFALTLLPAGVLADSQPDLKTTFLVANYGGAAGGTVFEREPNALSITVKNLGDGNAPASVIMVQSSDGLTVNASVGAIAAGGQSIIVVNDPLARPTAGGTVTYTVTNDPDNLIAESDETNNVYTRLQPVKFNGYKGQALFRDGGTNITTYRAYDIHGGLVHSFGSSYYRSGSYGGSWYTYNVTWTGTQPYVPDGATVQEARLYLPYTWDYPNPSYDLPSNSVIRFNGHDINASYQTYQWDQGDFGQWGDFRYGLLTYDVSAYYNRNGINVLNLTRPGANDKLSLYGMTLLVVYQDPAASRKQIFMNEGFDLLGADPVNYATNESEAIGFEEFSGQTIDMVNVVQANLHTFVPSGDSYEGNLYVNNVRAASNVWNYGAFGQPVGEDGSPQVALDVRDIKSYLKADGSMNTIGIQSTAWNTTPCMAAAQAFLIADYGPIAAFANSSSTFTSGYAPLAVTFDDLSVGATSWDLDFGDGSTHATGAGPWTHTYTKPGTYTVKLSITGASGSDYMVKAAYITVKLKTFPGVTNPPTDPNSDGKYEDVSGSGDIDFPDVQVYFLDMDWIPDNEPVDLFDYSNSGTIDFPDIQILFNMV
jgi:PKD repeat protein